MDWNRFEQILMHLNVFFEWRIDVHSLQLVYELENTHKRTEQIVEAEKDRILVCLSCYAAGTRCLETLFEICT